MSKKRFISDFAGVFFLAFFFFVPIFVCHPEGIRESIRESNESPENDFEWRLVDDGIVIIWYKGDSSDVVIPRKIQGHPVTGIGGGSFTGRNGGRLPPLNSVVIPDTVTSIGRDAFQFTCLTSVVIPGSVVEIGDSAFRGGRLTSVVIPDSVKVIRDSAFSNNELVSVTLPNGITHIGRYTFGINELESVVIPEGVTRIGYHAFSFNKLSSVTLPDSLIHIEMEAFYNNNLREISLPKNVSVVGSGAFGNNYLSTVTIPESVTQIDYYAFANGSLKEVIIHSENLRSLPQFVFHPYLSGYLIPGTYIKGDDENWFYRDSDGTLLSMESYQEKLNDTQGVLADLLYDAVNRLDRVQLRNCISMGADINSRMLNGEGNTPLDEIFNRSAWDSAGFGYEMVIILLEVGAIPQYPMLLKCFYRPDIVKMILERLSVYDEINEDQLGSVLLHYCQKLAKKYDGTSQYNPLIIESAALLIEYGADVNQRDSQSGQTPLSISMDKDVYRVEMTELLLKHVSRPLSHEEYRLLIGLYREKRNQIRYEDENREDPLGFNAAVLADIRSGLLNPESKDSAGKDIFDYAASGTADLMRDLLPYLLRSERAIVTANGTGLYIDALNANNIPVAAVLSTVMEHRFTAQETSGNTYSLEYYHFDRQTIHGTAQRIPHDSLHRSGPDGFRSIGKNPGIISYSPDRFFTAGGDYWDYGTDLTLYTVDGGSANLTEALNEKREQYYRESGKEMPDSSPNWYTPLFSRYFSDFIYVLPFYGSEHALVDISGGKASAYILDTENPPFDPDHILEAWDFVIDSGQAYLLTRFGDALVFNVGSHSLHYEKTVPFREIRIPGWKGGDWFFHESGGPSTLYNISTGTVQPMPPGNPIPAGEYHIVINFDRGHIYHEKNRQCKTICFFENGILTRKIIIAGSAVTGDHDGLESIDIHGNTLYMGMRHLAFTVDLDTMQINKAFSTDKESPMSGSHIYIFPFGADDIVYSKGYYDGDR